MHKSAVNSPHILLEEKLRISSILSVHSLFLHVNVNCRLIIHHVLDIKTGNWNISHNCYLYCSNMLHTIRTIAAYRVNQIEALLERQKSVNWMS